MIIQDRKRSYYIHMTVSARKYSISSLLRERLLFTLKKVEADSRDEKRAAFLLRLERSDVLTCKGFCSKGASIKYVQSEVTCISRKGGFMDFICTGMHFMVRSGFREYEVEKKLR